MYEDKRTRVNLTLKDDIHDTLVALSSLTGRSKAGIVTDLLYEVQPSLDLTVEALRSLKQENRINDSLLNMLKLAQHGGLIAEEMAQELMEQPINKG